MSLPAGDGPSNGPGPDGVIKVAPGVWSDTATPLQVDNNESDDIKAAVLTTLNDLVDALGAISYVQGAVNFAGALLDFSSNIELSLGCIAVDLNVVSSGLLAASQAFASLDSSLASTFANLESQMGYFTTDAIIIPSLPPDYIPLQAGTVDMSVGDAKAFHEMMDWGSNTFQSMNQSLKSAGAPTWLAVGVAGFVLIAGGAVVAAG